jgi:uncharacterized protein involved in exopolysaccharide biosynthesis
MVFEKRVLAQYEVDRAIYAAGGVINSTDVVDTLFSTMQADGLSQVEIDKLRENKSIENRLSTWELHIRDTNPVVAAKYANIWAGIAEQRLNEALKHALFGEQLQNEITSLQNCLPSATPIPEVNLLLCKSYSLDDINTKIQSWSIDLASEQTLSQGILPIMTFSLASSATVPTKPVLYNIASLVFAGACIGFILSLWIVNIRKVQRFD